MNQVLTHRFMMNRLGSRPYLSLILYDNQHYYVWIHDPAGII